MNKLANDLAEFGNAHLDNLESENRRLRAINAELVAALKPFAQFACDPPCECHNCIARAALTKAGA